MAGLDVDAMKVAKTVAIFCGAWTILLWVVSGLGFYTGAAGVMTNFHLFFAGGWDIMGLILGTLESAVYGFIGGFAFIWLYKKLP